MQQLSTLSDLFKICVMACLLFLSSCMKDEVTGSLSSVFEESDTTRLIIIDSIMAKPYGGNPAVQAYFHIRYELFSDTTILKNIFVIEESSYAHNRYDLHDNTRNYMVDINVSSNRTYNFQFGIRSKELKDTKLTPAIEVHVP